MFDRGYDNIFTTVKPILDKYGFKASIFLACDYIESGKGMNWEQVRQLYLDGYDIESHGSEHTRLTELQSPDQIESIVSGGKECLQEHGFTPTAF
jgi:peptidoglycan/xylan/chitin deacetylase (PgdA/CDA1 family)